jgi:hypothetical protein
MLSIIAILIGFSFVAPIGCGDSSNDTVDNGADTVGDVGSDIASEVDSVPQNCTCTATFNEDSEELACGDSVCLGSYDPPEDGRWVTCTAAGPSFAPKSCIEEEWAAATLTAFDCDGQENCPAGSYCVLRVGPEPRSTECRSLPDGCRSPTTVEGFCDCLEADAMTSDTCAGASGRATCDWDPLAPEFGCD